MDEGLDELLSAGARLIESERRNTLQYYRSIDRAVDVFSSCFGPTIRTLEMLVPETRERFRNDLGEVSGRLNRATDGTTIVKNQYSQAIVTSE